MERHHGPKNKSKNIVIWHIEKARRIYPQAIFADLLIYHTDGINGGYSN